MENEVLVWTHTVGHTFSVWCLPSQRNLDVKQQKLEKDETATRKMQLNVRLGERSPIALQRLR